MIKTNRSLGNFSEYQFKGNYNRCCNFPNSDFVRTSLNNNIQSRKNKFEILPPSREKL